MNIPHLPNLSKDTINYKYKYNELLPPPSSARGTVSSAHGTTDYYAQAKRGNN